VDPGRSLTLHDPVDRVRVPCGIDVVPTAAGTGIAKAGWLIAAIAVGLQTVAQLINALALAHVHPGLDAAADRNIFDWTSFSAASIAALSLLFLATAATPHGRSAYVLALLVAFLAVDDVTNLHDRLGSAFAETLPAPLDRLGDWSTPFLYLPLLLATFLLLWSHGMRLAPALARQVWVALALLGGAVAMRVLVGILEIRGFHASNAQRAIGIAFLEGSELGAWILVAGAFLAGCGRWFDLTHGGRKRTRRPRGGSRVATAKRALP
jgi:hypothetical protein